MSAKIEYTDAEKAEIKRLFDGGLTLNEAHLIVLTDKLASKDAEIGRLRIGAAMWEAAEAECEKLRTALANMGTELDWQVTECKRQADIAVAEVGKIANERDALRAQLAEAYEEAAKVADYELQGLTNGGARNTAKSIAHNIRALAAKHGGG